MKSPLFRNVIVTSLVAGLLAYAMPLSAAPRDRQNDGRNGNDSYYSQPDRNYGQAQNDSYRAPRDQRDQGQGGDDSHYYSQPDDRARQRDDSYRTPRGQDSRDRNGNWNQGDDRQRSYAQPTYSPDYNQPAPQPVYQQHRSLGKSVLIVGGSAAAGAGIGALAGGGKGAGIGAIVGGLGGLIFDRATAHH
ncbi:MAG TPA: hypothetical protein VK738_17005 [Terriglobales bacterium]|jgi:hypothetical protein|nr:hypothetical protein [Terriglobales bacterium]